jgi:hypothetical protein
LAALATLAITKADGTTAISWTGLQPSSGDGTAAVWKSLTVGNAQAHQPELRLSARDGNSGSSRVLRVTAQYPQIQTDSTTGVTSVVRRAKFSGEYVFEKDMPQTDVDEFVHQVTGCLNNPTFKSYLKSGYSAT